MILSPAIKFLIGSVNECEEKSEIILMYIEHILIFNMEFSIV